VPLMMLRLYDALLAAGVSVDKASAAATEAAEPHGDISELKSTPAPPHLDAEFHYRVADGDRRQIVFDALRTR